MGDDKGFEKWLEKLKKINPNLCWDLMHEKTMEDLMETYRDRDRDKDKEEGEEKKE